MVFNVFYRPLFFVYMIFDMFPTYPLFWFTCFLHASYRPPISSTGFFYIFPYRLSFFIHMLFTCFMQSPFFHLHAFYMFHTGPLFFIYMFFTCFIQAPIFHLHVFYMFLRCPLFSLTWFLQGFKRSISRLRVAFGRIIYTFFTGLSKAIYMLFTAEDTVKVRKIIYSFLHVLQIMIVRRKRQCKSVFTEHLHAVSRAVNFL